eukprot:4528449-Prymnesium_polylepis.1
MNLLELLQRKLDWPAFGEVLVDVARPERVEEVEGELRRSSLGHQPKVVAVPVCEQCRPLWRPVAAGEAARLGCREEVVLVPREVAHALRRREGRLVEICEELEQLRECGDHHVEHASCRQHDHCAVHCRILGLPRE